MQLLPIVYFLCIFNNANSAFTFMINLFIIQGCHSGSVDLGGQLLGLVRLVWWSRWSRL